MQKQDFNSLLQNYLDGKASPEEEALLASFFEHSGNPLKNTTLSAGDKDRLLSNFSRSPRFRSPELVRHKNRLAWLSPLRHWQSAAIWVLVIGSIFVFWPSPKNKSSSEYNTVYKEIKTGIGKTARLLLPDSSEIILNANSTLRYAADFARNRRVQLIGEALFKVHPDKAHPFRISTADSLVTEVLGTQFNINSYAGSPHTKVTVLSGRVQVQKKENILGILTRHQAIVYDRQTGRSAEVAVTATNNGISWIKGEWIYDGMNLTDLQALLENYYGITATYTGKAKQLSTDANMNFNQQQTAQDIVNIFCMAAGCRFKWNDKTRVELF